MLGLRNLTERQVVGIKRQSYLLFIGFCSDSLNRKHELKFFIILFIYRKTLFKSKEQPTVNLYSFKHITSHAYQDQGN